MMFVNISGTEVVGQTHSAIALKNLILPSTN